MSLNLATILQASRLNAPDDVVIRDESELTYGELARQAAGVAAALRARGIEPGDKVALLIPNVREFTIAYFGILYAGAAVVPINVLAAAQEVAYFLEDSQARLLIAHPLFAAAAKEGATVKNVPVIIAGGEGEGKEGEDEDEGI